MWPSLTGTTAIRARFVMGPTPIQDRQDSDFEQQTRQVRGKQAQGEPSSSARIQAFDLLEPPTCLD
ncbi:hypothetical protein R5M92_11000 [Halomonas sp. Bachu 37]|uniref:hypothetical protein n=1 Tax=Halomonas kashgarensis TaxID=3084920 RepID=UPI003216AE89